MKKSDQKVTKPKNNQPPLGTIRNPWYRIKNDNGSINYLRFTPYGIWLLKEPPIGAIIKRG